MLLGGSPLPMHDVDRCGGACTSIDPICCLPPVVLTVSDNELVSCPPFFEYGPWIFLVVYIMTSSISKTTAVLKWTYFGLLYQLITEDDRLEIQREGEVMKWHAEMRHIVIT